MPQYTGTSLTDFINASNDPDLIFGLGGDDFLTALNGGDTVHGGDGADTIYDDMAWVGPFYIDTIYGDDFAALDRPSSAGGGSDLDGRRHDRRRKRAQ